MRHGSHLNRPKKHSDRSCKACSRSYKPTGPAAKFCSECSPKLALAKRREITRNYRTRHGLIRNVGVGKGKANAKGTFDSQFKTGIP
jgi:hypothetical protein